MPHSMSVSDLEIRLRKMLETPKTTVSLDTNTFKPFCNIEVPGLDLTQSKELIMNGYYIPGMIISQRLYNKETAKAARYIQANNTAYIHLITDLFQEYDNLILPIQVKRELVDWIERADIEGYEKWIEGDKMPLNSQSGNDLIRIMGENPHFAPIFNVQREYKKAVKNFIENVPKEQIVDYEGNIHFSKLIKQLEDVKAEETDKIIVIDSYLRTLHRKDNVIKMISFDNGMKRIAKEFYKKGMINDVHVVVHRGYSPKIIAGTPEIRAIRFEHAFYRPDKIAI